MKKFLLFLFTSILFNSFSWAQTTYYVNDNSTTGDLLTSAVGNNANAGTAAAPFLTIEYALSQAANGDIIKVDAGIFASSSTINVAKEVTIEGVGSGLSTIDLSALQGTTAYGIYTTVDNITLKGFEILHPASITSTKNGFTVKCGLTSASPLNQNLVLEDLKIDGAERTPFDIHGVDGVTITNLQADNTTSGNGIQFTGCTNVVINSFTGSSNAWGSIAIYASRATSPNRASSNITIAGTGLNIDGAVYSQDDVNGVNNLFNSNISVTGWDYNVFNTDFRSGGDGLEYTFFESDASSAQATASFLNAQNGGNNASSILNVTTGQWEIYSGFSIQAAVDAASANDLVEINSGNYDEQVIINKALTLKGVGATKPIVDFTGTPALASGALTLFEVTSADVTIENFEFNIDVSSLGSAILASGATLNLNVKDNDINPYRSSAATTSYGLRNAISINYASFRVNNANPTFIIDGNTITYNIGTDATPGTADDAAFRSGLSADEAGGTFTNNTSQTINHDALIRFGSAGAINITNNNLNGGGVQLSDMNAGAGTLTVSGNTFDGGFSNTYSNMLRLQNNYNGITTNVSANTFTNTQWAVSLENYNTVTLNNNTFTPLANSTSYYHIVVNTKSISSNSSTISQVTLGATITNNTFNGSGTAGGTGVLFQNHDNDNASFGNFTFGSAGNENLFNAGIGTFVGFDNQTGSSDGSTFPTYPTSGDWPTTMACWDENVNIVNNTFDVGSGAKLPSAMTNAERTTLEAALFHNPDNACMGSLLYYLPVTNVTQSTQHSSIQEAIIAATAGDVIEVQVASFMEPGQIVIDKNLTIQGQGKTATTLLSNYATGTGHANDASAWIRTNAGTTVTIKDLTLDGNGNNTWTALRFKDNGTVDNVAFNDFIYPSYLGIAVQIVDGEVDITNSTFTNIGRIGAHYRMGVISGAAISGSFENNTYTGKGAGDWLDYALDVSGGVNPLLIKDNTISNNIGVALSDGSTSAGILVTSYFPTPANSVANNVTIEGNTLTGNTAGVAVGFDASDISNVTITSNDISGNDFGVTTTGPLVSAANNYWGAVDGPSGAVSGSGDAIDAGVNACPFYDGPVATGTLVNCPVQNVTSGEGFFYLQDAIDDVDTDPNDQITVASGRYAGNINIDKALDIRGANYGVSCSGTRGAESELNGAGTTITVSADNVSLDGFTITGDIAISSVGRTGVTIQNNIINANETGVSALGSVSPYTIQNNCVTLTNQTYAIQTFDNNPILGASQAGATWYDDRYAPAGFVSEVFDGDSRLKHSISAADCQSCRPASFSSSFYNTQGRKYDADNATSISIELYVPNAWATTGRRMAGFWGTGFNATNAISLYPIIEFTSDGGDPRFRVYNNGDWIDLGLPGGFTYDSWVTLTMTIAGNSVVYGVGDLNFTIPTLGTVKLGNVILQGHNTDSPGVTYDIFWDNLKIYGGVPGETNRQSTGIALAGVSGANAMTVLNNDISDAFYGYLLNGVNTTTQTVVEGGSISGVMQGVALVNTLDGVTFSESNVSLKDVTISGFAGDYASNAAFGAFNFHAGVYSFTTDLGSSLTASTLDIENCDIQGTLTPSQASAGIEIADFSSAGTTLQNVSIINSTISNNANRGIDVRGNVIATVTGNTLDGNGDDAWGTSGNDGYAIIGRNGAGITASLNYITHPASSTTNVYAFQVGNAPASTINAFNNSILMNGNADGYGAQAGTGTITAECNWWGSASGPAASLFTGTSITYIPWLIGSDLNNPDCTGGRVRNLNTGLYFADIQLAINATTTLDGHVIEALAGDYTGNIVDNKIGITKQLEIRGANYNIDPNTGTRGDESVIDGIMILLNDNITIDGFTFTGDSAVVQNDRSNFPSLLGTTFSGFTFSNNIVTDKTGTSPIIKLDKTAAQASFATSNWVISNNRFIDFVGQGNKIISLNAISGIDITDNYMQYNDSDPNTTNPITGRSGIELKACDDVLINANTIDMGATITAGMSEAQRDAEFANALYAIHLIGESPSLFEDVTISNNVISNVENAVSTSGSGTVKNIQVLDNQLDELNRGIDFLSNSSQTMTHEIFLAQQNEIDAYKDAVRFGTGASGSTYDNVQVNENILLSGTGYFGIDADGISFTGTPSEVIADCNWYGSADYAVVSSNVRGPVDYDLFATNADLNNLQCQVSLKIYAFLEGAFNSTTEEMNTDLNLPAPANILGTYATSQPFNTAPWNYTGTETVTPSFFAANDSIVDWVLIELRDPSNISTVLYTQAGFICAKGAVIDVNGNPIQFNTNGQDNFHIAIRHRNHGDVATSTPVTGEWDIRRSNSNVFVDSGGNVNLKSIFAGLNQYYVLYAGDGVSNNAINALDISPIIVDFFQVGYFIGDYDLSGFVNSVDADPVSQNFFITISFP